jgi:Uncharacterized alpha/beta hydrolase domain (DUF2235)
LIEESGVRHLISLIDGTWLTPTLVAGGNIYSNIHRINLFLEDINARDGNPQIVFYSRGLGAVSGIQKYTAGGFASHIEEEIEDAYINIASNYAQGDKIYLFGFSRGAVIARVVAGLISNVGLLYSLDLDRFPDIWAKYKSGGRSDDEPPPEYCHPDVKVEFVGVFDTVYGGNDTSEMAEKRLKFCGKRLSGNVKHAVHILAIDDQRPFFRPLPWEQSDWHASLKQIWMPGVHGDIGGIYPAHFLGDVSFLTMACEVSSKTKLAFETKRLKNVRDSIQQVLELKNVSINQEWTRFWQILSLSRKHYRRPPQTASNQYLHFVTDALLGERVNMRALKNRPKYDVRDEFKSLQRYEASIWKF